METRHIRMSYDEALSIKKRLLSSELNVLHILKRVKAYRTLKRKEIASRNNLRIKLANIRTKINLIQSTFPKGEFKIQKRPINAKKESSKKEKGENMQSELEEIRAKLERLK